eukprot:TRINITY_DN6190_c0_g1_i1.p1 TRINITY_DN6190_c0_g1~~TRINITY_DN6190_c0_g1_i1.p1  ORF type:complete len:281 (-),score=104.38 TRINITY_DN6190_c0_g1_i1:650-1492(-)
MDLFGYERTTAGRTWESDDDDDDADHAADCAAVSPVLTWLSPIDPASCGTLLVAVGPLAAAAAAELVSDAPDASDASMDAATGPSQLVARISSPQALADVMLLRPPAAAAADAAPTPPPLLLVIVRRSPPAEAVNAWANVVLSLAAVAAGAATQPPPLIVLDSLAAFRLGPHAVAADPIRRLVYPPLENGFSSDLPPAALITGLAAALFQKRLLRRLPCEVQLLADQTAGFGWHDALAQQPLSACFPALRPLLPLPPSVSGSKPRRGPARPAAALQHLYT